MKTNGYYKTLKGDVGKLTAAAALDYMLKDAFEEKTGLTIARLEFDNGSEEWWLDYQLVELGSPEISLFE